MKKIKRERKEFNKYENKKKIIIIFVIIFNMINFEKSLLNVSSFFLKK